MNDDENKDEKSNKVDENINDNDSIKQNELEKEDDQIAEGMGNLNEESSEELIYRKKKTKVDVPTIWNFDIFLHKKFKNINIILRYLIEIFVVVTIVMGPIILYKYIYEIEINIKNISGPPKDTEIDPIFRRNMFFTIIYISNVILFILGEMFLIWASKILLYLEIIDNLATWATLQSLYRTRNFWANGILFLIGFNLLNYMYYPFKRTAFTIKLNGNVIKTFILWLGILNLMIFLTKFLVDILTYKLKLSTYRDQVRSLNYKSFVFLKLKKISDATAQNDDSVSIVDEDVYIYVETPEDIAKNFLQPYDPGFYLTNKQFMTSIEDATTIANNIMFLLQKKHLEYSDIEKYFPENTDNVFEFIAGTNDKSTKISIKKIISTAENLYKKRRDMAATLRDRDSIFVDLEMIFVSIAYYIGFLVLLFLFKIDYKFFTASLGGFLLSFTWVFADSIKNIYNCFLFLLIIRPYNIGDVVQVENFNYTVYKIELFESVFLNDGNILTYIPNTKLININIKNFTRSPPRSEIVEIAVSENTTYSQAIQTVKNLNKNIKKEDKFFQSAELFSSQKDKILLKIYYKEIDNGFEEIKRKRDSLIELCIKSLGSITHFNSFVFVE